MKKWTAERAKLHGGLGVGWDILYEDVIQGQWYNSDATPLLDALNEKEQREMSEFGYKEGDKIIIRVLDGAGDTEPERGRLVVAKGEDVYAYDEEQRQFTRVLGASAPVPDSDSITGWGWGPVEPIPDD